MSEFNGLKNFSEQFRNVLLKYTLPTPPDIVTGMATIMPTNYASYLNDIGLEAPIHTTNNINPGSVDDHAIFRKVDMDKNLATPNDIIEGVNNLTQSETVIINYLDTINKPVIIGDLSVINPGSVDDHVKYREELLKQNISLIPEIQAELKDLSETEKMAKNYTDNLNQPAAINDKKVINPGSVDDHAKFREENLIRNQQVQSDILAGLTELSETKSGTRNYQDSIDKPAVISDLVVTNPGNVEFYADQQRVTNFDKNRKANNANVSQGGSSDVESSITQTIYNSWIHDVGTNTVLNNYSVTGGNDLDSDSVVDPASGITVDKNLVNAFNLNLYTPSNGFKVFDETILELKRNLKDNGQGFWTDDKISYVAASYTPADFLQSVGSLEIGKSNIDVNQLINDTISSNGFITDNVLSLLGASSIIKNESRLMQIAALSLRFNFIDRIKNATIRETLLKTKLDEAATNPITALEVLRDPFKIIEQNYQISVSSNPIGAAADLTSRIMGTISPTEYFGLGDFMRVNVYQETLTPKILKRNTVTRNVGGISALIDDLTGKSIKNKNYDAWLLARTGDGQKSQLFQNISFNRYRPDYFPNYNTSLANGVFSALNYINGITGFFNLSEGKIPAANYYLGKGGVDEPVDILQQTDGFYQEKTNEDLTRSFGDAYDSSTNSELVKIGGYGIISSEFAWTDKSKTSINGSEIYLDSTKFSYDYTNNYREGTLMDFTQKLVETKSTVANNDGSQKPTMIAQVINQLNKSFNDGYQTISRGSAVKGYPNVLDRTGRRDYDAMLASKNSDYCRVWTKDRPYGNITTTMRYSELLRLERNSVIDRYGNLNIYPTKLNVNTGYGNPKVTTSDGRPVVTEFYGQKRARKYMFSIENLAWRDTALERNLPPAEKGPNGGRIMWFPPYDINVTDNNSANWTSTVFLGRPEPIYTYNSTERVGTLDFKIVVDHPTILNVLVKEELKNLSNEGVEAILDSFWAGCLKYDIFDLAKMWGVFTTGELTSLKEYISQLNGADPHPVKDQKIANDITKMGEPDASSPIQKSVELGKKKFIESYVYFQNNVPQPTGKPNSDDDLTKIKSYDIYFNEYKSALSNSKGVKQLQYKVGTYNKASDKVTENTGAKTFIERYDLGLKNYPDVKNKILNSLDGLKNSWTELLQGTKGKDITAPFTTYASPLANSKYNKQLALRRFVSIAKFLILQTGVIYDDKHNKITDPNLCFDSTFTKATFYRPGAKVDEFNKITLEIKFYGEVGSQNAEHSLYNISDALLGSGGYLNTTKTPEYPFYPCDYTFDDGKTVQIRIVNTDEATTDSTSDNIIKAYYKKLIADGENVIYPTEDLTSEQITGANTIALASISGYVNGKHLRAASIIGSITSPIACLSRFGYFFDTIIEDVVDNTKKTTVNKVPGVWDYYDPQTVQASTAYSNITKRDIAQRILNKLITEGDYFNYLDKDYPGIFTNIKEKIKYFSPTFHAMTPEGLNSRLTFLQQCLRPGQTIISKSGESCDANNTAFGKPPVCILRIGDFYHSKIIIDSINFSYDPLVFDLNPEGIGVQPMIANVNMSFKFIGGQGLRKAVDQLQNALSFNYYGNTDIYDDRTFANTDEYERALINLETSPFDEDSLDISRIVKNAEKIKDLETTASSAIGTIGKPLSGDNIIALNTALIQYIDGNSYKTGESVLYGFDDNENPIEWLCIAEITTNTDGDRIPHDGSSFWKKQTSTTTTVDENSATGYQPFLIPNKALYPYQKEFGTTYIDFYKLNYWDIFNDLYNSLGRLVGRRINRYSDIYDVFNTMSDSNLLLANPMIIAGMLMCNYNSTTVPNPLYNTNTDPAIINMLSLPNELVYNGQAYSDISFSTNSTIKATKSNLITIDGTHLTIKKSNGGLYSKYSKADVDASDVNKFYNKFVFADDEFHKIGIDASAMNGGVDKTNIQLLMAHLYPQGGHYRMPNGATYSANPTSNDYTTTSSFAKLDFPGDTFITRPFQELFIPKPQLYNDGPRNSAIDMFSTEISHLISKLDLSAFRRDFKTSGPTMSRLLDNCDMSIKQTIIDQLTLKVEANFEQLKTAYNNYLYTSDGGFSNDVDAYYTAVQTIANLGMVLNGVDAGVDETNGQVNYYDIIPNGTIYNGDTIIDGDGIKRGDWEKKFGYNPYQELLVDDIHMVQMTPKTHNLIIGKDIVSYTFKSLTPVVNKFTSPIINSSGNKIYRINSLATLENYKMQLNQFFDKVSTKYPKYLLRTPMDYYIHQVTEYNYEISPDTQNANVGKTYNYGLPYISLNGGTSGSVISAGTIIDYVGNNDYTDAINLLNSTIVTDNELKLLPSQYKTLSGVIKRVGGANGSYYIHFNNPEATTEKPDQNKPNITTVFERMNHEFINVAQRFDQALSLDMSRQLMDINTIHRQNNFLENAGYTELRQFFVDNNAINEFDSIKYSNEFYEVLNIRSNSSFPVSVITSTAITNESEPEDFAIFRELINMLYYDKYLTNLDLSQIFTSFIDNTDFELVANNITSNKATEPLIIPGIRTFEEIMFTNLIYSGSKDIITSAISDIDKQIGVLKSKNKSTDILVNTKSYLNIVSSNIDMIMDKLTKTYKVVNDSFIARTKATYDEYQKIKPSIITDRSAYNLKLKKATSVSTVAKFLYAQRNPSNGDLSLGNE